jgi:hypothetical protein
MQGWPGRAGLQDLEPFKAADSVARFCLNLNLPQPIQDAVCKISLRALDAGFVNGVSVLVLLLPTCLARPARMCVFGLVIT